ncbi:hypothetical protein [Streptomyces jumonjinensis]|uniref:Uncharacterized protein n=1 Tax=Streptomyces jumonjinensis TaxID=1945 RepID=A0A646KQE0_STRJU|nr:hypothetical protein [Streptomyces jumonjinensis]MQT04101.1 hypothetical protein [Streptomyces jumonjinensis]
MTSENDRTDIVRHAEELAADARNARIIDANLARLRTHDLDARRAFGDVTFTAALIDRRLNRRLGTALENYANAKYAEGRMDQYGDLFRGTDDFDPAEWDTSTEA